MTYEPPNFFPGSAVHPLCKRFVYLVQSRDAQLPASYNELESADSDVVTLTWGSELPGSIYLPGSTWTQGRNRLLAEALNSTRPGYLYYIFLDDDLIVQRGDWREFERKLLEYEPAVGTPYCQDYRAATRTPGLEVQRCLTFDAMCNAFHREVVHDALVLPYYPGLDEQSWWFSQWFVIELALQLYPEHVLQINTVQVKNARHGEYPKVESLENVRSWFFGEVIRAWSYRWRRWLPHERIRDLKSRLRRRRWRERQRFEPAKRKEGTYALTESEKQCVFHLDAEFWRDRD